MCDGCLETVEPLAAEYMCSACRAPFASPWPLDENGLCALCRRGAQGFDAAYSFGFYDGRLRDLIHLFKYGRVHTLAAPLGRLLGRAYPREQSFDLVVPVPMHWRRRWQRGFNQAELLASAIGGRVGIRVAEPVKRSRDTRALAGLTRAARRDSVTGAFRVPRPADVRGKKILLIDDVLTTGATAGACARALKRAGARYVAILTVARADRRPALAVEVVAGTRWGESLDAESGSFA